MLIDLNRALKDPEGEFVENEDLDDGLTRRMGAITDDMLKNPSDSKKKKKGKIAQFFDKHPKARVPAIILLILILFFGSIGITSAILNMSSPKDVQIPNLVGLTEEEAKKIVSVLKDTEKRQDIESIGWAIANYFLPRKIEKIINSYEEKYKKEFKEINTLGFHIDGQHTSPIVRMFGIIVAGISFFEFEFGQSEEYLNEYSEFLVKSNNIAGENIIDLTLALSEIFNRNMTKEEAEKLLFVKSEMPKENIENYGLPPCQYLASEEFRNIIYKNKNEYIYGIFNGVRDIGWAIASYFNDINIDIFIKMGLTNYFNENDDRFAQMSKENDYKKFLEVVEKYKEIEPKVYDRMVKDFENNLKKIHYPLSPYSKPTVREE